MTSNIQNYEDDEDIRKCPKSVEQMMEKEAQAEKKMKNGLSEIT